MAVPRTKEELLIVFVYDTGRLIKEEDDPVNALVYFYPSWVSDQQKLILCGQIIGTAHCVSSIFSTPKIISLRCGKFVFKHYRNYILCVGTDRLVQDWCLKERADLLYNLISIYHKDLDSINPNENEINIEQISEQQREQTLTNMNEKLTNIFQVYLPLLLHSGIFKHLPVLKLPKSGSASYSEAMQLLQCFQGKDGVLGGMIMSRNKILASQLSTTLTKLLAISDPYRLQVPAEPIKTSYRLPVGIQLLKLFIHENDIKLLNEENQFLQSTMNELKQRKINHDNNIYETPSRRYNDDGNEQIQGVSKHMSTIFTLHEDDDEIDNRAPQATSTYPGVMPDVVKDSFLTKSLAAVNITDYLTPESINNNKFNSEDDILDCPKQIPLRYYSFGLPNYFKSNNHQTHSSTDIENKVNLENGKKIFKTNESENQTNLKPNINQTNNLMNKTTTASNSYNKNNLELNLNKNEMKPKRITPTSIIEINLNNYTNSKNESSSRNNEINSRNKPSFNERNENNSRNNLHANNEFITKNESNSMNNEDTSHSISNLSKSDFKNKVKPYYYNTISDSQYVYFKQNGFPASKHLFHTRMKDFIQMIEIHNNTLLNENCKPSDSSQNSKSNQNNDLNNKNNNDTINNSDVKKSSTITSVDVINIPNIDVNNGVHHVVNANNNIYGTIQRINDIHCVNIDEENEKKLERPQNIGNFLKSSNKKKKLTLLELKELDITQDTIDDNNSETLDSGLEDNFEPMTPLRAQLSQNNLNDISNNKWNTSCLSINHLANNINGDYNNKNKNKLKQIEVTLFVCGFQDTAMFLLIENEYVKQPELILYLWETSINCINKLDLLLTSSVDPLNSDPSSEYSMMHLHSQWGILDRSGQWGSAQLCLLSSLYNQLEPRHHTTEVIIKYDFQVLYAYQFANHIIFYHQNSEPLPGLPPPSHMMGTIALKARRRLERDSQLIII